MRILKKIYYDGHRLPEIRFLSEAEFNFSQDPNSPHRIAMTGDTKGSEIIVNKTLIEKLHSEGKLNISDLAGILTHEMVHHQGIKDDQRRIPDRVGAIIGKQVEQNTSIRPIDKDGNIKLHITKFGYKPAKFRDVFDWDTFSIYLEDPAGVINLTPYIKSMFNSTSMPQSTSLITLRDLDFKVRILDGLQGKLYEVELFIQHQNSTFDLQKFIELEGFDPTGMRTTEAQMQRYFELKPRNNEKFQKDVVTSFKSMKVLFSTNEKNEVIKNTVMIDQGSHLPAEISGSSGQLSQLRMQAVGPTQYRFSVDLKGFEIPKNVEMAVIARSLELQELAMLGPINAIPLKILKVDTIKDGVKLWFEIDDQVNFASRKFSVNEIAIATGRETLIIPLGAGVQFELPKTNTWPNLQITHIQLNKTPDQSLWNFYFRVDNRKYVQDAILFLEVDYMVDSIRFEKKLIAVDLPMSQNPKAKNHFSREWLKSFGEYQDSQWSSRFRVQFDPFGFRDGVIQSVKVHSIFVKDIDLRRDFRKLDLPQNLLEN